MVLFCRNVTEAEKIMNILHETCCRFGLNISLQKTKTQVFNNEELANMPALFAISGEVVENVSESTYLGQVFSNKDQENFTELRVSKAIGKFNEMRQVLTDNKVKQSNDGNKRKVDEGMCQISPHIRNTSMVHQGRLSEETGELLDGNV